MARRHLLQIVIVIVVPVSIRLYSHKLYVHPLRLMLLNWAMCRVHRQLLRN